jgi:hypothetical protein
MTSYFTAFADALIRLDMGTSRNLLQEDLHWLPAFLAFESKSTGRFDWHGVDWKSGNWR